MLAIGRWQIPCLQEIADQVRNDAMGERLPKANKARWMAPTLTDETVP